MIFRTRGRTITFPRRPLVMGILNLNEDSFCDDGSLDLDWAMGRVRELVSEGADIIDVGAESAIPADSEQLFPPLLSVNTWRPAVANAALAIAGDLLNDMSGLPSKENALICAEAGAALLIMHTVGEPKVPHTHVAWNDVIASMCDFFAEKIDLATAAGVPRESLVLDPGIDFAKQRDDNLRLLREADRLGSFHLPVLLPVSRKSVIGQVLDLPSPNDRDPGTIACMVAGALRGATIFRVHNVRAAHQAIRTLHAVA